MDDIREDYCVDCAHSEGCDYLSAEDTDQNHQLARVEIFNVQYLYLPGALRGVCFAYSTNPQLSFPGFDWKNSELGRRLIDVTNLADHLED